MDPANAVSPSSARTPPADVSQVFECPSCRSPVTATTCSACGASLDAGGVLDLVLPGNPEREFYDGFYAEGGHDRDVGSYEQQIVRASWEDQRVFAQLGDLEGKVVLVLGNGDSHRELHFLRDDPALLIYSDISPVALQGISAATPSDPRLVFAAVDAMQMALADDSIDVVYGMAFVHHLDDLDRFFAEVARVLRPGGHSVFLDDAYSPVWQRAKVGPLRPLMRLGHRLSPRSEQDLEVTMAGGFREDDLARQIRAVGAEPWFERVAFFYYLWKRLTISVFPVTSKLLPARVGDWARRLDERLLHRRWGKRNMIRLIWGMRAPGGGGAG